MYFYIEYLATENKNNLPPHLWQRLLHVCVPELKALAITVLGAVLIFHQVRNVTEG